MEAALRGQPSGGLTNNRKHMDCGRKIFGSREGQKEDPGHCQGAVNPVFSADLPGSEAFPILVSLFLGTQESQGFISPRLQQSCFLPYEPGLQIGTRSEFQGC